MGDGIGALVSLGSLRSLADGRTFERGEDYAIAGKVRDLVERDGEITATVRGTNRYLVRVWEESGDLAFECTCPVGDEGEFCKHCVAVCLVWLSNQDGASDIPPRYDGVTRPDKIRSHLEGRSKESLIELLLDQAARDEQLYDRLLLEAASRRSKGPDLAGLRRAIDRAADPGEFVDYRSAHAYATGVDQMVGALARLLRQGRAAEVVELTEYAISAVDEATGSVDDSDGLLGRVLEGLGDLHHSACIAAGPDPVKLAGRLFRLEMETNSGFFYGAALKYEDVLGKPGRAAYQKLAAAEWGRVPAVGPGEDDPDRYGRRFRITHIMERLAEQSGDLELLVDVKRRDLSNAFHYLEIADLYKNARQFDRALEWAERGVAAFPMRTDSRLREFLADEYHRRGRHPEAMALIWAEFSDHPSLERYKSIKTHADRHGEWPTWRERALTTLSQPHPDRRPGSRGIAWGTVSDRSELVRVFLWEGDGEAAWQAAVKGGCSDHLWMELAARRERAHPEDALPLYRAAVDRAIALKQNPGYEEAIRLLDKIDHIMNRLGKATDLAAYLLSIRAAHKPKRNFVKLLDRKYPHLAAQPAGR